MALGDGAGAPEAGQGQLEGQPGLSKYPVGVNSGGSGPRQEPLAVFHFLEGGEEIIT